MPYLLVGSILLWQFYLLLTVSGFCFWDPGIIILKAISKTSWGGTDYFSYNPNTVLLLLIEHDVWKVLGQPSLRVLTVVLGFINYRLLDASLLNLYWLGKKYLTQQVGKNTVVLGVILLGVMPWAVIPYSDIPSFALTIFSLVALMSFFNNQSIRHKYGYAALSGVLLMDLSIRNSVLAVIRLVLCCWSALKGNSWFNTGYDDNPVLKMVGAIGGSYFLMYLFKVLETRVSMHRLAMLGRLALITLAFHLVYLSVFTDTFTLGKRLVTLKLSFNSIGIILDVYRVVICELATVILAKFRFVRKIFAIR